jgi:hypothetical protein
MLSSIIVLQLHSLIFQDNLLLLHPTAISFLLFISFNSLFAAVFVVSPVVCSLHPMLFCMPLVPEVSQEFRDYSAGDLHLLPGDPLDGGRLT